MIIQLLRVPRRIKGQGTENSPIAMDQPRLELDSALSLESLFGQNRAHVCPSRRPFEMNERMQVVKITRDANAGDVLAHPWHEWSLDSCRRLSSGFCAATTSQVRPVVEGGVGLLSSTHPFFVHLNGAPAACASHLEQPNPKGNERRWWCKEHWAQRQMETGRRYSKTPSPPLFFVYSSGRDTTLTFRT